MDGRLPTVPDLETLLDDASRESVAEELRALAKACRARDYNTEGIPMVLVLEDANGKSAPGGGDPIENAVAAIVGAWALEAQDLDEVKPFDIATAFEVLAFRLLEPPDERDG